MLIAYRRVGGRVVEIWEKCENGGCQFSGCPVDAPYPPLPEPGGSRLLAQGRGLGWGDIFVTLTTLFVGSVAKVKFTPPSLLATVYHVGRWGFISRYLRPPCCLPRESFPGSGRLVGEVFRIVERDGDYLRLVGRGGDVYLAWDFVLGTLDSGEWVLFGEDGLYLAERRGEEVVVKGPYDGSIFDVRGPPYAPYYPVVEEVSWVKKALEKAREIARRLGAEDVYVARAPVDPQILLKWPLTNVKWEYAVECVEVEERREELPVRVWV